MEELFFYKYAMPCSNVFGERWKRINKVGGGSFKSDAGFIALSFKICKWGQNGQIICKEVEKKVILFPVEVQSKLLADSKELVHLEEVIVGDAVDPVIDVHTFLV